MNSVLLLLHRRILRHRVSGSYCSCVNSTTHSFPWRMSANWQTCFSATGFIRRKQKNISPLAQPQGLEVRIGGNPVRWLFCRGGFADLCRDSGFAYPADSPVDHGIEQLVVVQLSLALDVCTGLSSCRFAGRQYEVAFLGGKRGQILHHVEELVFAPAAHLPGLGYRER